MADVPFTADQLAEGIHRAFQAQDMEAAADFLRVLAVADPARAREVCDVLQLSVVIADASS